MNDRIADILVDPKVKKGYGKLIDLHSKLNEKAKRITDLAEFLTLLDEYTERGNAIVEEYSLPFEVDEALQRWGVRGYLASSLLGWFSFDVDESMGDTCFGRLQDPELVAKLLVESGLLIAWRKAMNILPSYVEIQNRRIAMGLLPNDID